jgi:hypothetical protein
LHFAGPHRFSLTPSVTGWTPMPVRFYPPEPRGLFPCPVKSVIYYFTGDCPVKSVIYYFTGDCPVKSVIYYFTGDWPVKSVICYFTGDWPVKSDLLLHWATFSISTLNFEPPIHRNTDSPKHLHLHRAACQPVSL